MNSTLEGRKILVVDDDPLLCQLVEETLFRGGAHVYTAADGSEGLHQFYAHQPELVILDIMMPGMNGWETCRHIRQFSDVPIIMLTSLGQENEIVRGLNGGADDYMTKPFLPNVLLARVQAILRRAESTSTTTETISSYSDDYIAIDLDQRRVMIDSDPVKLSAKEYRLLAYLLRHAGRVLTFDQILEKVWGWECLDHVDYVHVYMSHLRRKIEPDPKNPRYLITEHGVGYRFEQKQSQADDDAADDTVVSTQSSVSN